LVTLRMLLTVGHPVAVGVTGQRCRASTRLSCHRVEATGHTWGCREGLRLTSSAPYDSKLIGEMRRYLRAHSLKRGRRRTAEAFCVSRHML